MINKKDGFGVYLVLQKLYDYLKGPLRYYECFYEKGRRLKDLSLGSKLVVNNESKHDLKFKIVCDTLKYLMQFNYLVEGTTSHSSICQSIMAMKQYLCIHGVNDYFAAEKAIKPLSTYYNKSTLKIPPCLDVSFIKLEVSW